MAMNSNILKSVGAGKEAIIRKWFIDNKECIERYGQTIEEFLESIKIVNDKIFIEPKNFTVDLFYIHKIIPDYIKISGSKNSVFILPDSKYMNASQYPETGFGIGFRGIKNKIPAFRFRIIDGFAVIGEKIEFSNGSLIDFIGFGGKELKQHTNIITIVCKHMENIDFASFENLVVKSEYDVILKIDCSFITKEFIKINTNYKKDPNNDYIRRKRRTFIKNCFKNIENLKSVYFEIGSNTFKISASSGALDTYKNQEL